MSLPAPTPATFGACCMVAIMAAKKRLAERGDTLKTTEAAAIIDRLDADRASVAPLLTAPQQKRRKGDSQPFGDPKVIPPSPENVTAYSASIGYPVDGQRWCDSYEAKGWVVGKSKMKNWQCAVRNWKANRWGMGGIALGATKTGRDYTKF